MVSWISPAGYFRTRNTTWLNPSYLCPQLLWINWMCSLDVTLGTICSRLSQNFRTRSCFHWIQSFTVAIFLPWYPELPISWTNISFWYFENSYSPLAKKQQWESWFIKRSWLLLYTTERYTNLVLFILWLIFDVALRIIMRPVQNTRIP